MKGLIAIFLVCLIAYLPFSRYPDFFEGEYTSGTVVQHLDSANKSVQMIHYQIAGMKKDFYIAPSSNLFLKNGENVKVIYDTQKPDKADVYSIWGYWIGWKELLALVIGYIVLYQLAKAITSNPHPDAIKELEEHRNKPKTSKPRYGN